MNAGPAGLRRPAAPVAIAWESSAILHACRCDRADVLLHHADSLSTTPIRHVTTAAVVEELRRHDVSIPERLEVVHVDHLEELQCLVEWVQLLSSKLHDRGEATVCAWADVHAALAIIDDRAARLAAQNAGIDVHGTAWLVAQAVANDRETLTGATALLDTLIRDGARYPFGLGNFPTWAAEQKLLEAS